MGLSLNPFLLPSLLALAGRRCHLILSIFTIVIMDHLPLVISAISTAFIFILAAQTLWKFRKSSSNANQKKLYEDQDGVATEDSQKGYLNYVRVLKYSIAALWSAGCILALSTAILNTIGVKGLLFFDWITFASWVSKPISSTENWLN